LDADGLAALMADLRPRLHRYCARMLGSAFDGEDVVQDALASAAQAFPLAGEIRNPEGWLFRIAHNAALDALRRRKRQRVSEPDKPLADLVDRSARADARVATTAGLATFLQLSTIQRSTVVLADVLGHSLGETAEILGVSLAAVKAALHRGRARLQALVVAPETAPRLDEADRARLRGYADRFNAHDFDALRNMLSEEVRLELVNRTRMTGRKDVSVYFTRYATASGYRLSLGWAEGRPALLVSDPAISAGDVAYVILLDWIDGRVAAIRDFRFAPYVMDGLAVRAL
jgi:RNA polymerase sigma-70 factor, ECF subfamily